MSRRPRQQQEEQGLVTRQEENRQIVAALFDGLCGLPEGTLVEYDELLAMSGLPFWTEEDITAEGDPDRRGMLTESRAAVLRRVRGLLLLRVRDALIKRAGVHLRNVRMRGYLVEHQGEAIDIYKKEFVLGVRKTVRARVRADHIRVGAIADEHARARTVELQTRMNTLLLAQQNSGALIE
jgi:hypothetical protein